MKFARFMATPFGRGIRIVAGIALIAVGATLTYAGTTTAGLALTVVGTLLAVVGVANVCPLALLVGGPFNGRDVTEVSERTA